MAPGAALLHLPGHPREGTEMPGVSQRAGSCPSMGQDRAGAAWPRVQAARGSATVMCAVPGIQAGEGQVIPMPKAGREG